MVCNFTWIFHSSLSHIYFSLNIINCHTLYILFLVKHCFCPQKILHNLSTIAYYVNKSVRIFFDINIFSRNCPQMPITSINLKTFLHCQQVIHKLSTIAYYVNKSVKIFLRYQQILHKLSTNAFYINKSVKIPSFITVSMIDFPRPPLPHLLLLTRPLHQLIMPPHQYPPLSVKRNRWYIRLLFKEQSNKNNRKCSALRKLLRCFY